MANRREFVRGGVATLAGLSFHRALAAGASPHGQSADAAVLAIADAAFAAAEEFAVEADRLRIAVHGFGDDVGGLWLHKIEPALRGGSGALVGLTGPGVLLCLETLAHRYGFGTAFRAERTGGARGWTAVAARHAFAAAAAASTRGAPLLPPTEHVARPAGAEPPLYVWTIARAARRA